MKEVLLACSVLLATACGNSPDQNLELNELEYFETQGVNVLVYSNLFSGGFNDEKNSGIELTHHGVRIAQGGAIRLSNTPEQRDLVPSTPSRRVNIEDNSIEVALRYNDFDFGSRVVVTGKGKAVETSVYLDKPFPQELEGDAGFNLEFLPSQYWGKVYIMDGQSDRFPRYAVSNTITCPNSEEIKQSKGYKTYDNRGTGRLIGPLPLSIGRTVILTPDVSERTVKVASQDADLMLFDGRMLAQSGWFMLRSILPPGKTDKVLAWTVEPNAIKDWIREPNIGFSQVGYLPSQPKEATIELDKKDKIISSTSIYRVKEDGSEVEVFTGKTSMWGTYFKYNHAKFDFSEVKDLGIYYVKYGNMKTNNFLVDKTVYNHITDATTNVWIPIHINHVTVNEGYRIWHGEPFKEGYLQAPPSIDHFDLHSQGPTTDTKYKALELIPRLNVGGYFDADDFDIETGANVDVIQNFIRTRELFKPLRDETFVSEKQRYVDLRHPDSIPDIIQYIEHGVLNLVAQVEDIGHMSQTLSNSVLDNYHHLGDAVSITDGLHYDPKLAPYEKSVDGKFSGTPDGVWASTSRNPSLDFQAVTTLVVISRALEGYNDDLSARALRQSKRLLKEAMELMPESSPKNKRQKVTEDMAANLQLYVSTGEENYLEHFTQETWQSLEGNVSYNIMTTMDAIPYMDASYKEKLRPYVLKYREYLDSLNHDNPYGLPIGRGNWAGNGGMVNFGITVYFASKYFPNIIDNSYVFKVTDWLYDCHPYHNYSFVATVGATRPKAVFYDNNRVDFSTIPGNMAPDVLFRQPDHFENYDDWPFLWGQNEGTIVGNTSYVISDHAFRGLVR